MKLLVDFGNTRLKWATFANGAVRAGGVFAHADVPLEAALLREWSHLGRISAAFVASVVGAVREQELAALVRQCFRVDTVFLRSPAFALGIRNAYVEPARLGIDRFLGLAALHAERAQPLVLASVGTALTVDALGADGVHHGGLIVASPRLMRSALYAATARVAGPEGRWRPMPASTADAVFSGALYAAAGAVERFHRQAQRQIGAGATLLLAGGGADELAPLLPEAERAHDIVLRGLALWAAAAPTQPG